MNKEQFYNAINDTLKGKEMNLPEGKTLRTKMVSNDLNSASNGGRSF
ncbi:MAG: hypothetical protein IPP71_08335 [Bacteroidetes bacterium]|nr:hypothetical protein [Bacteroidota bacterium]